MFVVVATGCGPPGGLLDKGMRDTSVSAGLLVAPIAPRVAPAAAEQRTTLRVAYVMSRFPKLSETFVLYEMVAMRQLDVDVSVYPLVLEHNTVRHREARQFIDSIHDVKPLSLTTAGAIWHYLRRKPRTLLTTSWRIARTTAAPKRAFLASLATLPRAVWMAREMEASGVEHIHAHFATHATTTAYLVNQLTGIAFSFTAHAQDIYISQRMLPEKVRAAAFVVTISDFNKRFITDMAGDHYADKIQMVHCGVDTTLFRPTEAPRRPGVFRIVSVGRLVEMKGQRHLVEACRLLNERGIPFECAIIGAGPLEGALRRQIAEAGLEGRVQLAGGQARDAVLARVRGADVVVQPSVITPGGRMEGIPVALMEALACERAVIATRVSGIPELVHDGVSGLLVEAGDAIALAEALARLKHDPELRARLGAAGRRTVLAEFDLNANSALVRELFAEYHGHANAPR